jgi:hypothetical protein
VFLDLSNGTFDNEINFAEQQLQDMELQINEAITRLSKPDEGNKLPAVMRKSGSTQPSTFTRQTNNITTKDSSLKSTQKLRVLKKQPKWLNPKKTAAHREHR